MRWFRMYAEAIDDPKLKLLAFEDRWHFVAILCMKSEGMLDKHVGSPNFQRMVAAQLGLAIRDADEVRRRLMESELIDEWWQPMAWDRRQYASDSSADRVRKHRSMKRADETDETFQNVSSSVSSTERVRKHRQNKQQLSGVERHGNVTVTRPDTDTDTDTDTEGEKKTRAQGARLPPDWTPSAANLEYLQTRRPDLDPDRVTENFREYWLALPGKAGRKLDWNLTWNRWIREEKSHGTRQQFSPKPSFDDKLARLRQNAGLEPCQ